MGWLFDKCQVNLLIFWQSWLLPLCSCILWDFVMNSYRSVKQLFFCDLSTAFYHFNVPRERKVWKECAFFFNKSKYCFFFLCSNLIKYSDQAVCLWKVSICMEHRGITSEVVIYSPWEKKQRIYWIGLCYFAVQYMLKHPPCKYRLITINNQLILLF